MSTPADQLCQKFSPSTQAEALQDKHCENVEEENLKKICKAIVGSQGYDSSKMSEWSGTLKTIAASKGSDAMNNAGNFFLQFCVNPSTPQSNPKDVLCDVPAPTISKRRYLPSLSPTPVPGPTPTPAPDPDPQSIPGYEIFVVQTLTDDVEAWGPPETSKFGTKTCQSLQCFHFNQYGPVEGDHFEMLWTFDPICYDLSEQCADEDRPAAKKCSEVASDVMYQIFDRPICESKTSMPKLSCKSDSDCPCKDFWGCDRHMATPEQNLYVAALNPHGKPKGHVLLTQRGSLNSHCGKESAKTQLQGYMNPSWNSDNYYGGLPLWLNASICLVLGGLFFAAWAVFFWSTKKKKNIKDEDDDVEEDDEEKIDLHQPFLYNVPDSQVTYRCTKCSAQVTNLAEECFCSVCGTVLKTVLVVDPKAGTSRIRKNHYADRISSNSRVMMEEGDDDDDDKVGGVGSGSREFTPA